MDARSLRVNGELSIGGGQAGRMADLSTCSRNTGVKRRRFMTFGLVAFAFTSNDITGSADHATVIQIRFSTQTFHLRANA